ncbi:MAG: hypothetical protein F6J95_003555 [Leptolyngbya sp. SIO1E4]|nr:hypothetical protein [Leptolyngbya sp. SIO1E4]
MLIEVEFGKDAKQYIRDRFSHGNILAKTLFRLPIETGKVVGYLESNISQAKRHNFSEGGVAKRLNSIQKLSHLIFTYLSEDNLRIAIFEDALALKGDYLEDFPYAIRVFNGEHLYYIVNHEKIDFEGILSTIKKADSYIFICALVKTESMEVVGDNSDVDDDFFVRVSKNVDYVVVGAFDGESYLVCNLIDS